MAEPEVSDTPSLTLKSVDSENHNEEDVSSGSEGYETPEEDIKTMQCSHTASVSTLANSVIHSRSRARDVSSGSEECDSPDDCEVTLYSKPTLRELRQLPVTNWYLLGLQLEVKQQELERIQSKYSRDVKLCRTKMFGVWKRGDNPSYEKLLQGLVAVGRRDVVESICEKKGFNTGITSLVPKLHTCTPTEHSSSSHSTSELESQSPNDHHQVDSLNDVKLGVGDVSALMMELGEYAYKWRDLGTAFGFTQPELQNIQSKPALFATAPKSYLQDLLNEWVHWPNDAHNVLPTLAALEAALRSQLAGLGAVSDKVSSQLTKKRPSTSSLHQQPAYLPECVEKYAEFLKSEYLEATPLMPTGEWPPNRGRRYSDLTMVERVRDNTTCSLPDLETIEQRSLAISQGQVKQVSENEKVIQSLDDVLDQDSSKPLKVLMEGVPGVGKSTLVRKSCKDWADGKALKQFQLVILISLKELEISHTRSVDLEDLIEADDPDLKGEVMKHLRKTSGEHVLFVLDGLDELKENQQSAFLRFLQGKPLHRCSIVVTSRSSAVANFKHEEWIHRHVEILGFTEQQIESYFIQNIAEGSKAKTLVSSLIEGMSSTSVSYTPLNCSILLYIFQQGKYKMPSTLPELFEIFVYGVLKRHSKKASIMFFDKAHHKCLNTLPEPIKNQFLSLCKLAYNGLIKGDFIFSLQDIKNACQDFFEEDIEANLLSLLVSTTSFSSHGEESHYQFFHMTIQEYLAARWIKDQPEDEQKEFLSANLMSARMKTMLVFYAGITLLKGSLFDDFFSQLLSANFLDSILIRARGNAAPSQSNVHLPSPQRMSDRRLPTVRKDSLRHSLTPESSSHRDGVHIFRTEKTGSKASKSLDLSNLPNWTQNKKYTLTPHLPKNSPVGVSSHRDGEHIFPTEKSSSKASKSLDFSNLPCWTQNKKCTLTPHLPKYSPVVELPKFPVSVDTQMFLNVVSMFAETSNTSLYENMFQRRLIRALQLGHCRLTTADCAAFAKFLSKCPYPLEALRFDFCKVTHKSLEIFLKISTEHCSFKQCNNVELNYCSPSLSSGLSLLSQILWFKNTKVLRLHGLRYPEGSCPEGFQLHSILKLTALTDLTIAVEQIPKNHLRNYVTVFSEFAEALPTQKTLKSLTYSQTPAGTCESFVQLMSGLTHTNVSLTLGQTKIITVDSLMIPYDICFKVCSEGLFSVLKLAHTRRSKSVQLQQEGFFVPCYSCRNTKQSEIITTTNLNLSPAAAFPVEQESQDSRPQEESGCPITECSASLISTWLSENKTVQSFDISGCNPTDKVAKHIVEGLSENKTLEVIKMDSPHITSEDAVCILQSLNKNGRLILAGVEMAVSHNPYCLTISCASNGALSDSAIMNIHHALLHFTEVEELVVDNVEMQEDVRFALEQFLTSNHTLTKICLSRCELKDEISVHIANGLAKNHSLKVVDLTASNITFLGAMNIFKSLENNSGLEELNISSSLQLGQTKAEDGDESPLGCVVERTLSVNQTLSSLILHYSRLDDMIAAHIAAGLAKNHSLKVFHLGFNVVTNVGAVHIFKSLENNTSLEELSLSYNYQLPETSANVYVHIAVERMLSINRHLRSLCLAGCRLDDLIALHIAIGLVRNNMLKVLDLKYNNITSEGATVIFESLEYNTSLKKLVLSGNNLQHTPIWVVERVFSVNRTLKSLDLHECNLSISNGFSLEFLST